MNTVIVAATVLALGLRLYQFTRPGYLLGVTEYDDGSYFGSAVYLLRGILPYRDFIFVQPPGIMLLMTPAALLGKAAGTAAGMTAGRVLTALASTAGVALLGLLVRHRGVLTTLIACGLLAVFPASVAAAHTVLVEPWLTLFCLAGAVAVFDRDRLASDRRLVWGGVAFGFAGAVEAWAIIPVLVIFALSVRRIRRAAGFAAGVAAGFLAPVAPFAVLAPVRFYQSLIVAQIAPRAAASRVQDWIRVREMAGLSDLSPVSHANLLIRGFHLAEQPVVTTVAVVLTVLVLAGPAAAALLTHRPPAPLDWFALVTTVGVAGMFLWPSQFHYHFSAFLAPFLGLAVALPAGRLVGALRLAPPGQPDGTGQALQQLATGLAGFVIVACVHPGGCGEPAAAVYHPGRDRRCRAGRPAGLMCRDRLGIRAHPCQPAYLGRARMQPDARWAGHRPCLVGRADARHRGGQHPGGGRGLVAGIHACPLHLAHPQERPPGRLVGAAARLFRQPFHLGAIRPERGYALPASAQRWLADLAPPVHDPALVMPALP